MIVFNYETDFRITDEEKTKQWLSHCLDCADFEEGLLSYIFCDDNYLHKINLKYLQHDTYTDVISFDYTEGKTISGDIFISVERLKENAVSFQVPFEAELKRVMIHGVLHCMGYGDKTAQEKEVMRRKEDFFVSLQA